MQVAAVSRVRAEAGVWGRFGLRATTLIYLTALLVVPLAVLLRDSLSGGLGGFWQAITVPTAWHALLLTLWTAGIMAVINAVMGVLTAYVLVRYDFPLKRLLDAVIDLPLAIPTLVTGVMLVILYGPQQSLGMWFSQRLGLQIIFAPPGIVLALLFLTFPFVVRAIQPVLEGLDRDVEAAAATLGAHPWTIFTRVTLPALVPPIASGTLLSFARGIGEFGAIVIVAGNIPFQTQTAAVYVFGEVESDDRLGASAMSVLMLAIAFALIVLVDAWQRPAQRRAGSA